MHEAVVPGTEGYAGDAAWLAARYDSVASVDKFRAVLHLLPAVPGTILDVGAGSGADAAWLTQQGHRVTAIEPVAGLREAGRRTHASSAIEWVDDSLPALSSMASRREAFDAVLLIAVFMHLSDEEREVAMRSTAALLKPGAVLVMSLRHGPAPANRRMFDVSAHETIALAQSNGLELVMSAETPSVQLVNRQAGVCWSWLVFRR